MTLILNNAVVHLDRFNSIYMKDGQLCFDNNNTYVSAIGVPDNALQQIAVAEAEGKSYLEMDAKLDI